MVFKLCAIYYFYIQWFRFSSLLLIDLYLSKINVCTFKISCYGFLVQVFVFVETFFIYQKIFSIIMGIVHMASTYAK